MLIDASSITKSANDLQSIDEIFTLDWWTPLHSSAYPPPSSLPHSLLLPFTTHCSCRGTTVDHDCLQSDHPSHLCCKCGIHRLGCLILWALDVAQSLLSLPLLTELWFYQNLSWFDWPPSHTLSGPVELHMCASRATCDQWKKNQAQGDEQICLQEWLKENAWCK